MPREKIVVTIQDTIFGFTAQIDRYEDNTLSCVDNVAGFFPCACDALHQVSRIQDEMDIESGKKDLRTLTEKEGG